MTDELTHLREENAYLRAQLGEAQSADDVDRLCRSLEIRPAEAKLLMALYAANGRVLSKASIEAAVIRDRATDYWNGGSIIRIYVSRLRKKLGGAAIETVWAVGLRLSQLGMDKIAYCLATASPGS